MAGPWLKYRGHLENISGNLYLGAVNAFEGYEVGYGKIYLLAKHKPSLKLLDRIMKPTSLGL
ncbi:MAG: hypothetical protein CM15mP49_03760 [Actinomycetota bacterium]|nr:MAG: hypothetical protein CM15mP49_03760 [Actinomycetota bacterium]